MESCKAVGNPCRVFSPFTPCPAVTPSFLSHRGDSPARRCAEVPSMPALLPFALPAVGLVCWWGGLQPVKQADVASINVLTWLTRWQKAPRCPELSEKRLNWLGFLSRGEEWQRKDYERHFMKLWDLEDEWEPLVCGFLLSKWASG